ncbi:unnamed protein product [Nezara viridula]|uniref:RRM domain-containing protein n=1 Tax=Nezara viridula TaxID=85310 RepID=A0A9P0HQC2_NEZVI|nr:unnamed protein product [Nezara viridula]
MNGSGGQNVQDQPDPDFIKMFVGQVPRSMDEADLTKMFSEFGRVHQINVLRDKVTGQSKELAEEGTTCSHSGLASVGFMAGRGWRSVGGGEVGGLEGMVILSIVFWVQDGNDWLKSFRIQAAIEHGSSLYRLL